MLQLIAALILGIGGALLDLAARALVHMRAAAFTTANLKLLFTSWQGIVVILIGIAVALAYITVELFSMICLLDDVIKGRQKKVFRESFSAIGRAFRSLPRFFRPAGILILLYILIALPLIGVRIFLSLNRSFRIPRFMMGVIEDNNLYLILYWLVIAALVILGILFLFSVYGVLIDGRKPGEAAKRSLSLIRKNKKAYFLGLCKLVLIIAAIEIAAWLILRLLPYLIFSQIPESQTFPYHLSMVLTVIFSIPLYYLVQMFVLSYVLLRFAAFYNDFSKGQATADYEKRTVRHRCYPMVISFVLIAAFCAAFSVLIAQNFEEIVDKRENIRIVAHRTGGNLASENSVEGIEQAASRKCEGSETDIQRTKDGQYVINHDGNFKRLTGDQRKPKDMTLAEIKELRIKDTTGSGALLPVPTLEELLDASAGKVKLYIELKGETADTQMVDDVVKLVKEKYKVNEVALISLEYKVIDYAETAYPEFETGVLLIRGYGDVNQLNCDMIMLEEDALDAGRVAMIQSAGKKAYAWTVNEEEDVTRMIAIGVDGVITDQIDMANKVRSDMEKQSDYERLEGMLYYGIGLR